MRKLSTSFRLSERAKKLLALLSQKLGISLTDVLELAIRKLAEGEGIANED